MFRNYLIVAFRNLLRNKTASFIKITSLSVGMICFAVISLFVYHELSYDRFHKNPEQVYRVVKDFVNDDGSRIPDATTPPAFASALQKDMPEVAHATRIFPNWGFKFLMEYDHELLYEEKVVLIDSNFFDVFSFPFVKGSPETSARGENFILLTESAAKRLYGDQDPLGKSIKITFANNTKEYFISGILKDVPQTSHFSFEFLIPLRVFRSYDQLPENWGWYNFYTYVRLKPETNHQLFQSKIQPLFKKYNPQNNNLCYAQPLTDIHLKSNLKWELSANGDYTYIWILGTIAIFIILLAVINYINLVTAQSARRAKEVGIRKVSGAVKNGLINQFLFESTIFAITATIFSIAIAETILPLFQHQFNATLTFFDRSYANVLWMILSVGLVTGLLAGLYPALYISSFQPVKVLKASVIGFKGSAFLRKGLVSFQFIISTVLIIGTFIISSQINFIRNKKLGFNQENVLLIHNAGNLQNREALMNEIKKISTISNAGGADGVLGGQNWTMSIRAKNQESYSLLNFLAVDFDFLEVMSVNFKEGRNFSRTHSSDSAAIIINATAVKQLGLVDPVIGTQIEYNRDENGNPVYATLIGIINDFHFTSFHEPIKPFGFILNESRTSKLFVKLNSEKITKTIAEIKNTWTTLVPNRPFEFTFQDEQVAKLYAGEVKFQSLFSSFAYIAIIIACLGLFGLSEYTAQQRTKEIGIRKVLGASAYGISQMLSKEFLKLIFIAIVMAVPIAWYVMKEWLQNFVYRIDMNIWMFIIPCMAAVLIALLTVSFQCVKAAFTNPVNSLRNE